MSPDFYHRLSLALDSVRRKTDFVPELALIAGTGIGPLLDEIRVDARISYADIEQFPLSTAPGHTGELVLGTLTGRPVVAMNGRFHAYEGWSNDDLVLPVYLMKALGADTVIVTNAAGGLNEHFSVGDVMLISDHVNLQGVYPLAGPNDERLGVRFPDLSQAYDQGLQQAALDSAESLGMDIQRGIYVAVHGPALETNAERRFCRLVGGDAVGMSTAIEVVAANHAGMRVLGFSAITNAATGSHDQQPDTVEQILKHAQHCAVTIRCLLVHMLENSHL